MLSCKYWSELSYVIVESVIVIVVSVSHLEEGLVDLDHLIFEGPVRVPEAPAGVLDLHLPGLHEDAESCLSRRDKQGACPGVRSFC